MCTSVLTLVLVLVLGARVQAYDGCEEWSKVRCGEHCADYCECGNTTISRYPPYKNYDQYHCCHQDKNSGDTYTSGGYTAVCPEGQALPLTEPCRGQCNSDEREFVRNTVKTNKNTCVRLRDKCFLQVMSLNHKTYCKSLNPCQLQLRGKSPQICTANIEPRKEGFVWLP